MRKGQFYLLTAAILISLSFVILMLARKASFAAEIDSFSELKNNYLSESSEVINNILYEKNRDGLPSFNFSRFESFSDGFVDYSKVFDNGFSVVYALTYHNTTEIKNYIASDINVNNAAVSNKTIITSNNFTINVDNIDYFFEINKDIELNILFRSDSNNNTRVLKYDG